MGEQRLSSAKWFRFLLTLAVAFIGGFVFAFIHMPIPWLLGPMTFVLVGSKLAKGIAPYWPGYIRNTGMIIIGYTLGLSFTVATLVQMGRQLPVMILMTMLLLLLCAIIAYIISRLSGIPFPTVLMGSIPGGLTQMVALAEDTKGIDLTVVTFLQVSRLIMIIFIVPMLIYSPMFGSGRSADPIAVFHESIASWQALYPNVAIYGAACVLLALLANRIKFPTSFLLGPMLATILLPIVIGLHGPTLPAPVIEGSQLMIGTYVGLLLKPENLKNKAKVISLALVSGVILIVGAFGLSALLAGLKNVTPATAFLGLSPGGMDQMGIIAQEIHADIAIVTCYQLFRTLFIFLAVPSLLKMLLRRFGWREGAARDSQGL